MSREIFKITQKKQSCYNL